MKDEEISKAAIEFQKWLLDLCDQNKAVKAAQEIINTEPPKPKTDTQ